MTGTGSDAGRTFNSAYDQDPYQNPYYHEGIEYSDQYYQEGYLSSQPLAQDSSRLRERSPNPYDASQQFNKASHYVTMVLEELRKIIKFMNIIEYLMNSNNMLLNSDRNLAEF